MSPLKKIKNSKDQYDKVSKEHFKKQLNEIHRAQKDIIQENHLNKFPEFHQKQLIKIGNEEEKEAQMRLLGRK